MSDIPAVRQAQCDLELGRLALAVYDVVRNELDVWRFRPLKLSVLESRVLRSRPQVVQALSDLTARGYVERGARAWANGPWTYRLCYSRGVAVPPPDEPAEPESAGGYGMMSHGLDW